MYVWGGGSGGGGGGVGAAEKIIEMRKAEFLGARDSCKVIPTSSRLKRREYLVSLHSQHRGL